jgi:hypothetical protein
MVTRYNKKTVSVITDDGRRWTVSPRLLQRVGSPNSARGAKAAKPQKPGKPHQPALLEIFSMNSGMHAQGGGGPSGGVATARPARQFGLVSLRAARPLRARR